MKGIKGRLNRLPSACVGDMVMATVKKGKPDLHNAGVIVNPKGEMKGSAITGPIGKECADLWPRIASAANAIETPFEIENELTPLGLNACSVLGPSNGQVIKVLHKASENESDGNTTFMEVNLNGAATVVAGCSIPSDVYVDERSADISMEIPTAKCDFLGMALDNSEGTRSNEVEPGNLAELMLKNEMLRTMVETNRNFDQGGDVENGHGNRTNARLLGKQSFGATLSPLTGTSFAKDVIPNGGTFNQSVVVHEVAKDGGNMKSLNKAKDKGKEK
ncbi:unnamed protein product [Ilex paraguariensis]|uniref:Uncharacterized protein n=1 Tax=Ilex paraguariensis TaxID=185542 RepID=A0ABC8SQ09_9AQUA